MFCGLSSNFSTQHLSWYIPEAISTKILLAGYWDTKGAPSELKPSFVLFSALQAAAALGGLILAARKSRSGFLGLFRLYEEVERTGEVRDVLTFIHLFTFLWLFWLGMLGATIPYAWLSAPTSFFILLHVYCEFPMFILRCVLIDNASTFFSSSKEDDHPWRYRIYMATRVLVFMFALNVLAFATTSNPHVQGALASLAFVADFGNLVVAPWLSYKIYQEYYFERGLFKADLLVTILNILHVFTWYIPILKCEDLKFEARWLTGWALINLWLTLAALYLFQSPKQPRRLLPTDEVSHS